jgi:hypothetical protein
MYENLEVNEVVDMSIEAANTAEVLNEVVESAAEADVTIEPTNPKNGDVTMSVSENIEPLDPMREGVGTKADESIEIPNPSEGDPTMNADGNHETSIETTSEEFALESANTEQGDDCQSQIENDEGSKSKKIEYPLHPYCAMFPKASDSEIEAMAENIRKNGQHEPINLLMGKILEGRNRELACKKAGKEPWYKEYDGDTSPDGLFQFVMSKNSCRRHMKDSQKAMFADRLTWERSGDPPIGGLTQVEAGTMVGISVREIQRAAKLRREGTSELIARVELGEITIQAALMQCKDSTPNPLPTNQPPVKMPSSTEPEKPDTDTTVHNDPAQQNVNTSDETQDSDESPTDTSNLATLPDESGNRLEDTIVGDKHVEVATPVQTNDSALKETTEQVDASAKDTFLEPMQSTTSDNVAPDSVVAPFDFGESKEPEKLPDGIEVQLKSYMENVSDAIAIIDQMPEEISLTERSDVIQKIESCLERQRTAYHAALEMHNTQAREAYRAKQAALSVSASVEEALQDTRAMEQLANAT